MAKIEIEVPDDLLLDLGASPEERIKLILEAVAVECFQNKDWSTSACGKLMGIPRVEFVAIQMRRRLSDNLTGQDLVDGFQAIDKIQKG